MEIKKKIEIVRITKVTGDIYYWIKKDGSYVDGTCTYAGKDPFDENAINDAFNRIMEYYQNLKKYGSLDKIDVILEDNF